MKMKENNTIKTIVRSYQRYRPLLKFLAIVLLPLLLSPLLIFSQTQEAKAGYVLLLVSIYWCSELLPLGITGLIPALLFPLFGVVPASDVANNYMKEGMGFMVMVAFAVCAAIEKCNLHLRIALHVLLLVGFSPVRLLFGFIITCMLLSMWISNSATTTIMLPVAETVLQQLRCHLVHKGQGHHVDSGEMQKTDGETITASDERGVYVTILEKPAQGKMRESQFKNVCKAMCLCVAYGSTIGGSATLIGSPAILVAKAQVDIVFEQYKLDAGITFLKWTSFALPLCLLTVIAAWVWLQFQWFGFKQTLSGWCSKPTKEDLSTNQDVERTLRKELAKLGKISMGEMNVLVSFLVMVALWVLRKPGLFPGWAEMFPDGYTGSSLPPLLITIWFFIAPSRPLYNKNSDEWQYEPLLDIDTLVRKIPWSLFLLFGGGLALAEGCQKSGLSELIGNQLVVLQGIPTWALVTLLSLGLSFLTEITSNTAVISIIMPVLAQLAIALELNPMQLMIPSTLACTYAFMLPVATPPNAIVFTYGHLKVMDMVKTGFALNLLAVFLSCILSNTWGYVIFQYHKVPTEMMDMLIAANVTSVAPTSLP